MNELDKSPTYSLYKQGNDVVEKIIEENDVAKAEDLKQAFKFNQMKKNIARANKLSQLQDLIDDELMERVANTPEAIENKELVQMFNAASNALHNTNDAIENMPVIQINNTEFNIGANDIANNLSRASRERVLNALSKLIKNDDYIDVDVEERDDEEGCI